MKKNNFKSIVFIFFFFQAMFIRGTEIQKTGKLTGVVPEPQKIYVFKSQKQPFKISVDTVFFTSENYTELYKQAIKMLNSDIKTAFNFNALPVNSADFMSKCQLFIGNNKAKAEYYFNESNKFLKKLPHPARKTLEAYKLIISNNGILVSAPGAQGIFYGVQTLRQLITKNAQIPSLLISDWPDQDIRASYGFSRSRTMEEYIRKLASLKINMAIMESPWNAKNNWWYNPTGKNLDKGQGFFRLCRKYNIEPVPFIQGFGWAYGVIGINPNCSEGQWIQNEKCTLAGKKELFFKNPNVIRTPSAPIIVNSNNGKKRYLEKKDYKIIPGLTIAPFKKRNRPWAIARTENSAIKDGETVLLSYNYCTYSNLQTPYCPLEPKTNKIVDRVIKNVINIYKPKYLHIGHDEVRYINRCSRCRQSGLSNTQIVSKELNHWYKIIKTASPKIKIMIWYDLFFKKKIIPNEKIFATVPKDLIICPWLYGGTEETKKQIDTLLKQLIQNKQRSSLGTGSGYTNNNIWIWKDSLGKYKNNPINLGFMFSYWGESENNWSSLSFASEYMWSNQKPARKIFDLYNAADILLRKQGLTFSSNFKKQKGTIKDYMLLKKNIIEKSKQLTEKINAIVNKIRENFIPNLAKETFSTKVNNERILLQIVNTVNANEKFAKSIDKKLKSKIIKHAGKEYIELEITKIEIIKAKDKQKTEIYDLKFPHYLTKAIINPKAGEQIEIALSNDNKLYTKPGNLGTKINKKQQLELTWLPQEARFIKVSSSKQSHIKSLFALKSITSYEAINSKRPATAWTSDDFWQDAQQADDFITRKSGVKHQFFLSEWKTQAKLLYDDKNLYAKVECYFPDIKMLEYNNEKLSQSTTPIWENDCIQLFIQPQKLIVDGNRSFYQIIVNAGGNTLSICHNMKKKKVNLEVKTKIKANKWICFVKIPLIWFDINSKNLTKQEWGINFGRTQRYPINDRTSAYSSWMMLPQHTMLWFLQPEYYAILKFASSQKFMGRNRFR